MEREGNVSEVPLPQSDEKDRAVSSQVLEYYKQYSQNRNLPKYFCGASSSFKIEDWHGLPKRKSDDVKDTVSVTVNTGHIYEEAVQPSVSQSDRNNWARSLLIGQDNLHELPQIASENVVSENGCATSPVSSIASNRKLEWDNGADIGYNNAATHKTLQKSISLPVLSSLEYRELQKCLLRLTPEGNSIESLKVQVKQPNSEKSSNSDLDISSNLQASADTKATVIPFNAQYSSSSSENINSSAKQYVSSSSSSGYIQKKQFSSSKSSNEIQRPVEGILTFLKGKVGLPIAESTPTIRDNRKSDPEIFAHFETPRVAKPGESKSTFEVVETTGLISKIPASSSIFKESCNLGEKLSSSCENLGSSKNEDGVKKWHSQIDLSMVDRVSCYKVLKLCASKPIIVECIGVCASQAGHNKFIQTSLPRHVSIAIQTGFDYTDSQSVHFKKRSDSHRNFERQKVLYMCHSDSDKGRNTLSSGTQTGSDVLSNCNSFEYLYGADYDRRLHKSTEDGRIPNEPVQLTAGPSTVKKESAVIEGISVGNLKRCLSKSDLTMVTPNSEKTIPTSDSSLITSKESPLAELLSRTQSIHLVKDLEKNVQLLQDVLKSKKYDEITKRHYLKRLVQKMVDAKYAGDSSGSYTTSQNYNKKINPKSFKRVAKRITVGSTSESSDINSKSKSFPEGKLERICLQDNKPWIPFQRASHDETENSQIIKFPQKRSHLMKLQSQTFINEIVPANADYQEVPLPEQPLTENTVLHKKVESCGGHFVPIQVVQEGNDRKQRNPLFTLTDHGFFEVENVVAAGKSTCRSSDNSTANELYEMLKPPASEIVTPAVSTTNSSNSKPDTSNEERSKGFQSWRDDKTRSEQLLEEKVCSGMGDAGLQKPTDKDHLVHFATKEREHQLYWINSEISYLNRLKKLLQPAKRPSSSQEDAQHKVLQTVLQQPHVEDMNEHKKATTVYIVTTEKPSGSKSRGCTCCNNPCCSKLAACSCCKNPCCAKDAPTNSATLGEKVQIKPCSPKPTHAKCTAAPCQKCKGHSCVGLRPPSLIGRGNTICSIENDIIDLKNARLVSSEQFTTGRCDGKVKTSIRRYTYEVPLEGTQGIANNVELADADDKDSITAEYARPCRMETENGNRKRSSCSPTRIIKIQDTERHQITGSRCPSPRTLDRLTRQLVITDEFVSSKPCVGSGARSCVTSPCVTSPCVTSPCVTSPCVTSPCVTAPITSVKCTITSPRTCSPACVGNKTTQTSTQNHTMQANTDNLTTICSSSSSSSSSSTTSVSQADSSPKLCRCCKRKSVVPVNPNCGSDSTKYILCHPCYQNQSTNFAGVPHYTFPGHVCQCHAATQSETIQCMRKTIQELSNLEKEEDLCRCVYSQTKPASDYCARCNCKLRSTRKKGGLAYILTLESEEEKHKKHKKCKQPPLQEIRITVPNPQRKKGKDRQPQCVCSEESKSSGESAKENLLHRSKKDDQRKNTHKQKSCKRPTLQDYLCANKPDFITSAEQRRKCLLELAYMREQRCQKYKQLLALTSGIPFQNSNAGNIKKPRIFSSKEMKEITAKNYKKLPEVQQKLVDNRDKQIKKANRMLANIFNQKLREHVLNGKLTLPTDASIIKLI